MSRDGTPDEIEASIPLASPRAQHFPDLDAAVLRLEEHINMNGDASGPDERSRWNAALPENSYCSSGVVGERYGAMSPFVNEWESSETVPEDEEDLGGYPSHSQHAAPTRETPWHRMRIVPKSSPIDPFADNAGANSAEYGAIPIGKGAASRPFIDQPTLHSNTQSPQHSPSSSNQNQDAYRHQYTNSFQYPQATASTSSSHDYDPEGYAMYSTPNKLYSHPPNSLPISRSPTPSDTPPRPSLPSATTSRLTRRVLSSKENTPRRPGVYNPKDEEDYEVENHVSAPLPSPIVDTTTMHFGLPPRKQRRRHQEGRKLVPLTHGNFVMKLPVPPNIVMPEKTLEESLSVRYTGVTCDPEEFVSKKYFLRQNVLGRETEIAIAITMYNEDEVLLCRTLYGVMKNIQELSKRKSSRTWGKDAWRKIVVIIIADGRKSVHPRVLDCLSVLGVYRAGRHMNNVILGEAVTAHLFEYTTTMALDPNIGFQLASPMQVIFCLKEKNTKKINSHRWFFSAFCRLLQPNVCILLDVGTHPGPKSLYRLWKTFDLNSNVGGACGEIAVYKGKWWRGLLNPLVAAQNFEYKMSNILDKPLESMMGYITVLPGAFSAYRYIALQNDPHGVGPLSSYFKGEIVDSTQQDIFTRNMYLAEDRILCFELVAKKGHDYVLRYVKGAIGETDVPFALPEFISQRRRWLNGSLFASLYAIAHFRQVLDTEHSTGRKITLVIEEMYNILTLLFGWFSIGNYYCFFIIVTSSLVELARGSGGLRFFNALIQYMFSGAIAACFVFSMGNKPRASKWKYKSAAMFFAVLSAYMIVATIVCAVHVARLSDEHGALYAQMKLSVIATLGLWVASSILALDPWHILTSGLAYVLLSPAYIIMLNIFAFGNLDDISWGTKQQDAGINDLGAVSAAQRTPSTNVIQVELTSDPLQDTPDSLYDDALKNLRTRKPVERSPGDFYTERVAAARDYYANIRTNVLLVWVLSNGILVISVLSPGNPSSTFSSGEDGYVTRTYMTAILVFVAIASCFRFAGSTLFLIVRLFTG